MNSERRILRRFCAGGTAALAVVLGCAAIASANGASGSSGASGASGGTGPSGATAASLYPKLLTPPAGDVFTGLSGIDPGSFQSETGKHPAVYGFFITWAQNFQWAFNGANAEHSRLMLHISTSAGYGAYQEITPAGIADGSGDGYILALQAQITKHNAPVYIRLLPEMNNANNAYSADNADGSSRGPDYSHKAFIAAWRRTVLIMRGGPVATIDAKLKALRLPPLQGRPQSDTLPVSPIAFIWAPETAGTPNVPSESAASYWPGRAYVDWVGTDFYSAFPNFTGLQRFYNEFRRKPFVFAEWAMWRNDSPAFVDELFSFINTHRRVKMILYNNGFAGGPLLLDQYPAAQAEIRKDIAPSRFLAYTPEW